MGMNRIRARLEALEGRSLPPTVIREEDRIGTDLQVLEADRLVEHLEAEMRAKPGDPALRSAWLDACRTADAARNHAASRLTFDRPVILLSYRHEVKR
jgi:hypothetical protein